MSARPRLLVVDDEPVVCQSCSRIFQSAGVEVDTSTDPYEGLRKATTEPFSLILLDIKMPGMEGIEFLERLREANPGVPVIVITGYSSVESAAAAMRLGAIDYIPKPFTPAELTAAVRRVLTSVPAAEERTQRQAVEDGAKAGAGASVRGDGAVEGAGWVPASAQVRFLEEAWVRIGANGNARVGAFLSPAEAALLESVHLPRVGEILVRGLPLLSFVLRSGTVRLVPSPVSGEVVAVNPSLSGAAAAASSSLFDQAWAAEVRGPNVQADAVGCSERTVIIASADPLRGRLQARTFERLGCRVHLVANPDEASGVLGHETDVLFLDGSVLGREGPSVVRWLRESHPSVKAVVLASPATPWEGTYRESGIFYYCVEPLTEEEAMNITASAFRKQDEAKAQDLSWSGVLPSAVNRIRITAPSDPSATAWAGRVTCLLASGETLERHKGLGYKVIRKLLDAGLPVSVTHGSKEIESIDLLREARSSVRTVMLEARSTGRVPGTLARSMRVLQGVSASEPDRLVPCLVIEPQASTARPLDFEPRILDALAEQIFAELVR